MNRNILFKKGESQKNENMSSVKRCSVIGIVSNRLPNGQDKRHGVY